MSKRPGALKRCSECRTDPVAYIVPFVCRPPPTLACFLKTDLGGGLPYIYIASRSAKIAEPCVYWPDAVGAVGTAAAVIGIASVVK